MSKVLFPPNLDLSDACSCPECLPKIATLKAFEKEINAKMDLISKLHALLERNEFLCLNIENSSNWTKRMFFILQRKLKALSEKSGVPFTLKKSRSADNLKITEEEIVQIKKNGGLFFPWEEETVCVDNDYDDDVLDEIDAGRLYYGHTKAKRDAYLLLEDIEKIEKDHRNKKETAEKENKMLDPSFSKKLIEEQVEFVKKLPVGMLKLEMQVVIDEIQPRDKNWELSVKARDYIEEIWFAVITKRNEFFERSPVGKEHNLNGLNKTLDLLILQFTSFEEEWQRAYANFFTPRNRADPKRQRTKV